MSALVSIITPCYNAANYIAQCITSVQNQTYTNWEMLIVDDCSSDHSVEAIKMFQKNDKRIKLMKLEVNSGAAISRNKALEYAQGDYIAFLDADDLWLPNKLERQILFMQTNKYAFTYSSYEEIDEKGHFLKLKPIFKPRLNYRDMWAANRVGCLTAIYDVKQLGKMYMPNIRKRQDYALWLSILKQPHVYCFGLNEVLSQKRVIKSSISSNKLEMLYWNFIMFRKTQHYGVVKSLYCLGLNIFNRIKS